MRKENKSGKRRLIKLTLQMTCSDRHVVTNLVEVAIGIL